MPGDENVADAKMMEGDVERGGGVNADADDAADVADTRSGSDDDDDDVVVDAGNVIISPLPSPGASCVYGGDDDDDDDNDGYVPRRGTAKATGPPVRTFGRALEEENARLRLEVSALRLQLEERFGRPYCGNGVELQQQQQQQDANARRTAPFKLPTRHVLGSGEPLSTSKKAPSGTATSKPKKRDSFDGERSGSGSEIDDASELEPDLDLGMYDSLRGLHHRRVVPPPALVPALHPSRNNGNRIFPLELSAKPRAIVRYANVPNEDDEDEDEDEEDGEEQVLLETGLSRPTTGLGETVGRGSNGNANTRSGAVSTRGTGAGVVVVDGANVGETVGFWASVQDRAGWLVGLLVLQSMSSFIISRNEDLLEEHLVIVQFLTMLVGAGGNAGNQASVGGKNGDVRQSRLSPSTTSDSICPHSRLPLFCCSIFLFLPNSNSWARAS